MDYSPKQSKRTIILTSVVCLGFFVSLGLFHTSVKQSFGYYLSPTIAFAQESKDFIISQHLLQAIVDELKILRRENTLLQEEIDSARTHKTIFKHKPRVLLVAGHTQESQGTRFGSLTEYELNYETMMDLQTMLRKDGDYEVIVSHEGGDYTQDFLDYFTQEEDAILAYREQKKQAYNKEYPQGVTTNDTDHNYASDRGVIELYGINKWATDHNIDIVVHLHFNDYPGRTTSAVGEHEGFAVFVPLKTNSHFIESFTLAKFIEKELLKHDNRSTVQKESAGVLESELIAVGQANSVQIPAVLVEGGFIYEERFTNPEKRSESLKTVASSIYRALERYVESK